MITAIVFIVVLGILIFVHELGHFVVARRNGIRAEEFGFGFPPRIFGVQVLEGKKLEPLSRTEEIKVEVSDYQTAEGEVIQEKVTDKIRETDLVVPIKRWRFIWGKHREENKEALKEGTIYSLNWIPVGGFVRIKGENGENENEPDSFAAKSPWTRIKVLGAGVTMNFILAFLVISLAFWIGAPQEVDQARQGGTLENQKIQISQVVKGSPAEQMGIKMGDEIVRCVDAATKECEKTFISDTAIQHFIRNHLGQEITLEVKRGNELLVLSGTPRMDYPATEGPLGVGLVETAVIRYPWYQALLEGFLSTLNLSWMILRTFWDLLASIFTGQKMAVDVAGPVGIIYFTKQVTELGFVYILQFIALLSINLGIINALPFPALDGGRILFILIEKIKGSPVSQKFEQATHTIGFLLLITLMIFVTFKDLIRFNILDKIRGIF